MRYTLAALAVVVLLLGTTFSPASIREVDGSFFFHLLDLSSNSWLTWAPHPLTWWIPDTSLVFAPAAFVSLSLRDLLSLGAALGVLFFFGFTRIEARPGERVERLARGITVAGVPLLLVGLHPVVLSTAAAVALLVLAEQHASLSRKVAFVLLALGFSWHLSLFALVSSALITRRLPHLALVIIALTGPLITPAPLFPSYPEGTHVVAEPDFPGTIAPLFGPYALINVVDHGASQESLFLAPLLLLCGFVAPGLAIVGILIGVALLPPSSVAFLTPLFAAERLIPGLYGAPLFLLIGALLPIVAPRVAPLTIIALVASLKGGLEPALLLPNRLSALEAYAAREAPDPQVRAALLSPSHALLRNEGLFAAEASPGYTAIRRTPEIRTSPERTPEELALLTDGDETTRWIGHRGEQRGDEWIEVLLDDEREIVGITLDTGPFITDFPRGLRIRGGASCDGDLPVIFERPRWEGTIALTQAGLPYHKPRAAVRVMFPQPVWVRCLRIEQTAQEVGWDWSVAELSILRRYSGSIPK